jgi:hypothetical protein
MSGGFREGKTVKIHSLKKGVFCPFFLNEKEGQKETKVSNN